jgi:dethiobiotin synthetase
VGVFKPIASGCRHQREGLVSDDAEFLSYCAHSQLPLSVINPVTFRTAAAPVVCEEFENRRVDFGPIVDAYKHICQVSDFVIVEGIGGVRVPITAGVDVLDMAAEFALPVVIVTRPNLGTINHTLLTIEAVRGAGLTVAGLVINGYDVSAASIAEETVGQVLADCGQTQILSVVPYDEESDTSQGALGPAVVEALDQCNWQRLVSGR